MLSKPLACLLLVAACGAAPATRTFQVTGMVLRVDPEQKMITISEDKISNYMDAMVMSYQVRDTAALRSLQRGMGIEFTLNVEQHSSYVSDIHVRKFDSSARDPVQARTLALLESTVNPGEAAKDLIPIGGVVPDFSLTDQSGHSVMLSDFRGQLVAVTFIYTRCPLPDYCFRLSNNFGQLQKRFNEQLGRKLVLLSITFDPVHDRPEVLANYAAIWKADAAGWRFLTGPLPEIKRICSFFGMNFWPDEGLMTHSLHTVIIGQDQKLRANLEGNQFTAQQLGDLVQTLLAKPL